MSEKHWLFIITLAVAAYSIRLLGLLIGDKIRNSRYSWMLDDLPGLIIISLVAASMADQSIHTWLSAFIALAIAIKTNHVILTMGGGIAAFVGLGLLV
ncbi:AzlD domain-containing protein [Curvivirga aplysinae]|uniref:AzlD domain-containing protein n=1 Tax=Curvivirga aplysinae TaxID=2529852 RepID=UPI0012BB7F47|nr:AzlD domain-containing protein [Curvivirga aplysinae]MTI08881.1 AzlD domain-containing protein [Curvivirga aplysinae]